MNFTKVIFRSIRRLNLIGSWSAERSAKFCSVLSRMDNVRMASRVEVCFIGESDFVNNEKDFILKDNPDNPDWEIDSTISLELTDSLMR